MVIDVSSFVVLCMLSVAFKKLFASLQITEEGWVSVHFFLVDYEIIFNQPSAACKSAHIVLSLTGVFMRCTLEEDVAIFTHL